MIDCSVLYHKYGLYEYEWSELQYNQLVVESTTEFTDWITYHQSISPKVKYMVGDLRRNFELYLTGLKNDGQYDPFDLISPKQFNIFLKVFARLNGLEMESVRYNGKRAVLFKPII